MRYEVATENEIFFVLGAVVLAVALDTVMRPRVSRVPSLVKTGESSRKQIQNRSNSTSKDLFAICQCRSSLELHAHVAAGCGTPLAEGRGASKVPCYPPLFPQCLPAIVLRQARRQGLARGLARAAQSTAGHFSEAEAPRHNLGHGPAQPPPFYFS